MVHNGPLRSMIPDDCGYYIGDVLQSDPVKEPHFKTPHPGRNQPES
jgi:hypothetical protein